MTHDFQTMNMHIFLGLHSSVVSLTFHELDCQHTEDMRSVMMDRLLGTLFLSVSTTMHCLCLTLGTSSNISTSRPTSTLSTFEFFTLKMLYKFSTYLPHPGGIT